MSSVAQDPVAAAATFVELQATRDMLITSKTYLACLWTLLMWDWLVTSGAEYQRFWRSPWSALKVVYLFNRYFGIAKLTGDFIFFYADIPARICSRIFWFEIYTSLIMVIGAEFVLVFRVYALFERKIWVWHFFGVVLAAQISVSIWAIQGSVAAVFPPKEVLGIQPPCVLTGGSRNVGHLWVYWLCAPMADSIILVMTLFQSYRLHVRGNRAPIPILRLLVRDGIALYVAILSANLLNVVWYRTKSIEHNLSMHAPLAMVVTTIAASRLCLNMRNPAYVDSKNSGADNVKTIKSPAGLDSADPITPTYPLRSLRSPGRGRFAVEKEDLRDEEKGIDDFGTSSYAGIKINTEVIHNSDDASVSESRSV